VIVWDARAGTELWRSKPHGDLVTSLAWSPNGQTLASSGFDGCGRWRRECLVLSRRVAGAVQSRVLWNDTYHVPRTLSWLTPNQILVTVNQQARVVPVPAE
jgi:WD40 repeat protein